MRAACHRATRDLLGRAHAWSADHEGLATTQQAVDALAKRGRRAHVQLPATLDCRQVGKRGVVALVGRARQAATNGATCRQDTLTARVPRGRSVGILASRGP